MPTAPARGEAARFGAIHALPSGMASHTKVDRTLLFDPYLLRGLSLKNRLVMAPMTRNRATAEHVPTPIMATYYAERADIGLLITEGTSPAPDGLGYPRISGLYSDEQVAAWKPITAAVHARGGKIFVQLMHTGRASHALNLPAGARVVGPMAVALRRVTASRWKSPRRRRPQSVLTASASVCHRMARSTTWAHSKASTSNS